MTYPLRASRLLGTLMCAAVLSAGAQEAAQKASDTAPASEESPKNGLRHDATVAVDGVKKGITAGVHGVERGAHAAKVGIQHGAHVVAKGIKHGAAVVASTTKRVVNKVDSDAAQPPAAAASK